MYYRVEINGEGLFRELGKILREKAEYQEKIYETTGYVNYTIDEAIEDANRLLGELEYKFEVYPNVSKNTKFAYTEEGFNEIKGILEDLMEICFDYFGEIQIRKVEPKNIIYKDWQQIGYI